MSFITLGDFKNLYASKPLFVLDTNIYLNLLRYSKTASIELFNLLKKISGDIYIPEQVKIEFTKNLDIVANQRKSDIKNANTQIKLKIEGCKNDVQQQLDLLIKRGFGQSQEVADKTKINFDSIKSDVDNFISTTILSDETNFLPLEDVETFFNTLYQPSTAISYSQSKLLEIYKDGNIRYKYKIPPGYMDDPEINKKSKKDGVSIFGDLIMWNQILDFADSQKRAVVFASADSKEDWFQLRNEQPIAPRSELIKEFNEQTNGMPIGILTQQLLVEYLGNVLSMNMELILLEMQMDDYVDIVVRNKQSEIINSIIEWANEKENILQFPFIDDISTLCSISNPRIVVKNTAIKSGELIKYMAILHGTADFVGANHDKKIERYIDQQEATFLFDVRISFTRSFESDENGRKPSKEVSSISIDGGVFEAIPVGNVPLESKRGVFILPNDRDRTIYDYMQSIWYSYENKNSMEVAEAFVYIDAAEHFNCSLLEINRAFTLVQNQQTKMNLSINEIDALALKRFSDIRIAIQAGMASFRDKEAPIGDAYPMPESLAIPQPEMGKEIDVDFSCVIKHPENKYIQIEGTTNLPPETDLMLTVLNKHNAYMAQSKASVSKDGSFKSEIFSNAKNNNEMALMSGDYTLEIIVPIFSVQPDSVKARMGKQGRNLIGKYVSMDNVLGKTIRYIHYFNI